MSLRFHSKEYSDSQLDKSISQILERTILCSIATVGKGNSSYIHTAYFAFNGKFELFFLSDPDTQHCLNIEKNPSVAVAVADSRQPWQELKQGLQLFGTCQITKGTTRITAEYAYIKRFVGYRDWVNVLSIAERKAFKSRFYIVKVQSIKLFDEPTFGEEVYIDLNPHRV